MKKPIGSQFSFSNLDGARASIDSVDRLSISERQEVVEVDEEEGTVSFPAASPEFSHVSPWRDPLQDEKPEWNESFDKWVKRYWGKYPPSHPDEREVMWKKWIEWNESFDEWVKGYWGKYPPFHPEITLRIARLSNDELEVMWKKWKEQMKEEKEEEEKEEKNETTDPTSTLGSSRNPTVPCTSEVTTEPIDENRCQRPLQRARERREARLQKESDAHAVTNSDPHDPGSQRSRVSRDPEQDRPQLKCDRCNNRLTDSDWSKIKSKGWDAEIVEHAPFCASCIDHWRAF